MCLKVNSNVAIATQDMIVYKPVLQSKIIDINNFTHGAAFKGVINKRMCSGAIALEKDRVFYCTDDINMSGQRIANRLGYSYSWVHDSHVTSIEVDGVEMCVPGYITPYQDYPVILGRKDTTQLRRENDAIYEGFHSYENLKDARDSGYAVIIQCIIPRGAEYYAGTFDGKPSYASSEIVFVKEELLK